MRRHTLGGLVGGIYGELGFWPVADPYGRWWMDRL